jgi:hypothetical protein
MRHLVMAVSSRCFPTRYLPEPAFLDALVSAVERHLDDCKGQGVANIVSALAVLEHYPGPALWKRLDGYLDKSLGRLQVFDMTTALWGLVVLNDPAMPASILEKLMKQLSLGLRGGAQPEQVGRHLGGRLWCTPCDSVLVRRLESSCRARMSQTGPSCPSSRIGSWHR